MKISLTRALSCTLLSLAIISAALMPMAAQAATLGGLGAVDSNGNWIPGYDIVDKTHTLSAGTVRSVSIYFTAAGTGNQTVRIKVWRQSGTDLLLVGTSGDITIGAHGIGVVTAFLPTPITGVQAGDFPGIQLNSGTANIDAGTGAYAVRYKAGNVTSGLVAESSFSNDTAAPAISLSDVGPLSVTAVTPAGALNNDSAAHLVIDGTEFVSGATVKLTKTGQSDINATNVVVASSTRITADVNVSSVTGSALGAWNVIVTNPSTVTGTLSGGFRIFDSTSSVLGGYGAIDSNASYTPGSAPGRDLIDKTHTLAAGTVRSASIYLSSATNAATSIRFKVWRQNGTNFDLVGESGSIALPSGYASGSHSLLFPSTIPVQYGDFPGVFINTTGGVAVDCAVGSYVSRYKTSNTLSGSVAESTFSNDTCALALAFSNASALTSVAPLSAVNSGTTTLTVVGGGFAPGLSVKLTKSGQPDIIGANVAIASSTQLTADFGLTGSALGAWTVVVTNADTSVASLSDGFAVTSENLFMGIGDSIAEGHPTYHGPEHTGPSGNPLSQPWVSLSDILQWDYYNAGIGGQQSSQINSRIQALLDSKDPERVYLSVGINDIAQGGTLSNYIANLSSILTKVNGSGAELIMGQILPDHETSFLYVERTKLWNASVEKWALDNNVKLAPTYLEMSSNTGTNDDELLAAYDVGDHVHLSLDGNARLGVLFSTPAVPAQRIVWGDASFPTFPYASIRWFSLSGGASVSGNSDTGSLVIPQNAAAVSNVFTIPPGPNPFTITPSVTSGAVTLSYRTSSTNFMRSNSSISWIPYTGSVTIPSDQFVQVRIQNTAATSATVTDVTASWGVPADVDAPVLSAVVAASAGTSAQVTWTSDEDASSIVDYGLTASYGNSTPEADTSPRVTSHSAAVSGLSACSTYHYRVRSKDAALNIGTSADGTFTTTGCTGSATVLDESADEIDSSTGGTADLLMGGTDVTLAIPAGAAGTDAVFQIKSLDPTATFVAIGTPSGLVAANLAFDFKAYTDVATLVTSFSSPISVTFDYQDSDVADLDESTLQIYRYDGSTWSALSSCTVDTAANSITCSTSNFSIFGLFGSAQASVDTSSSRSKTRTIFGCKDTSATNYNRFSSHKQSLCIYGNLVTASGASASVPTGSAFTRDLGRGSEGTDVTALQNTLIAKGHLAAGNAIGYFGALTEAAVRAYQQAHGISPVSGFVGPLTRTALSGTITADPIPAPTTPASAVSTGFSRDLTIASSGEDVRALQQYLNTHGYPVASTGPGAPGSETTMFGYATEAALKRFQQAKGIVPATGYFGPKTRESIK